MTEERLSGLSLLRIYQTISIGLSIVLQESIQENYNKINLLLYIHTTVLVIINYIVAYFNSKIQRLTLHSKESEVFSVACASQRI